MLGEKKRKEEEEGGRTGRRGRVRKREGRGGEGRRRKREDTSCHKLLHAACWKGGVFWSLQVQIEPVGKLDMSTQLHWVILVLVRNVDQETTMEKWGAGMDGGRRKGC